jgi:hypothetical protein
MNVFGVSSSVGIAYIPFVLYTSPLSVPALPGLRILYYNGSLVT